jgi:hypothetical protein
LTINPLIKKIIFLSEFTKNNVNGSLHDKWNSNNTTNTTTIIKNNNNQILSNDKRPLINTDLFLNNDLSPKKLKLTDNVGNILHPAIYFVFLIFK